MEIKDVAKKNPEAAAFGVTIFMEKCWESLVNIDSSSGQIGIAVSKALAEMAVLFGMASLDDQQINF